MKEYELYFRKGPRVDKGAYFALAKAARRIGAYIGGDITATVEENGVRVRGNVDKNTLLSRLNVSLRKSKLPLERLEVA